MFTPLQPSHIVIVLLICLGLWLLWNQTVQSRTVRLSGWNGMSVVMRQAAAPLRGAAQPQQGRGAPGELRPHGNPLRAANTVITQGYGIGTHAPVEVWGALDLALDGDGDGEADPEST